jgi:glycosyltransferase involved in cell wall biosynthesis
MEMTGVDPASADPRESAGLGAGGPSITTIIPVWNEAEAIETTVTATHEFLAAHFADFEILIVESGSTDGSIEICDRLAASLPGVTVVHEGAAKGFGSALRLGYAYASKDLVWVVSADLPFPLAALLDAMPLLADRDCVLSYRVEDERGPFRRFQSLIYNGLAKALLGLSVRHVNSTFKVYRRPVIQGLALVSDGWLIDTEIVYRLQTSGARLAELPVPLIDRQAGSSTIRPLTPFLILRDLLKFAWRERRA